MKKVAVAMIISMVISSIVCFITVISFAFCNQTTPVSPKFEASERTYYEMSAAGISTKELPKTSGMTVLPKSDKTAKAQKEERKILPKKGSVSGHLKDIAEKQLKAEQERMSKVLNLDEMQKDVAEEMKVRPGMQFRLVSDVESKLDVAVFRESFTSEGDQKIVDMVDSAAMMQLNCDTCLIADHNYQGFDALHNIKEGDLVCMVSDKTVKWLRTVFVTEGHNTKDDITDENYNSLYGSADYVAYTCMDSWKNIYACGFEEI